MNKSYKAISAKDLSVVEIKDAYIENSNFCLEAIQKKQEFGGGKISFENFNCDNENIVDNQSTLLKI